LSTAEQPAASENPADGGPVTDGPDMGAGGAGEPTEEQLRAAYAAELSRVTSADMVLQAAASLLNIGAYRLGLLGEPEAPTGAGPARDLEQVRDAIDAVRGLLPVIERSRPAELTSLRQALSQLQMAYASEVQGAGAARPAGGPDAPAPGPGAPAAAPDAPPAEQPGQPAPGSQQGPGPAESSGRLWVPGR